MPADIRCTQLNVMYTVVSLPGKHPNAWDPYTVPNTMYVYGYLITQECMGNSSIFYYDTCKPMHFNTTYVDQSYCQSKRTRGQGKLQPPPPPPQFKIREFIKSPSLWNSSTQQLLRLGSTSMHTLDLTN